MTRRMCAGPSSTSLYHFWNILQWNVVSTKDQYFLPPPLLKFASDCFSTFCWPFSPIPSQSEATYSCKNPIDAFVHSGLHQSFSLLFSDRRVWIGAGTNMPWAPPQLPYVEQTVNLAPDFHPKKLKERSLHFLREQTNDCLLFVKQVKQAVNSASFVNLLCSRADGKPSTGSPSERRVDCALAYSVWFCKDFDIENKQRLKKTFSDPFPWFRSDFVSTVGEQLSLIPNSSPLYFKNSIETIMHSILQDFVSILLVHAHGLAQAPRRYWVPHSLRGSSTQKPVKLVCIRHTRTIGRKYSWTTCMIRRIFWNETTFLRNIANPFLPPLENQSLFQ